MGLGVGDERDGEEDARGGGVGRQSYVMVLVCGVGRRGLTIFHRSVNTQSIDGSKRSSWEDRLSTFGVRNQSGYEMECKRPRNRNEERGNSTNDLHEKRGGGSNAINKKNRFTCQ